MLRINQNKAWGLATVILFCVYAEASSSSCSKSGTHLPESYLKDLNNDDKLVVEMFPVLKKHINIPTTAGVMRQIVNAMRTMANFGSCIPKFMHAQLLASCLETDYDDLYQRMSTGQNNAMLEWQTYAVTCLKLAATREIVFKQPVPIYTDNDQSPALQSNPILYRSDLLRPIIFNKSWGIHLSSSQNRARITMLSQDDLWKAGFGFHQANEEVGDDHAGLLCTALKQSVSRETSVSGKTDVKAQDSNPVPCSTSRYLTLTELRQLKPDEKLVLDMFPLLQRHARVYTTAKVMRKTVDHAEHFKVVLKEMETDIYHGLLNSCLEADHEKLFHRMNTGQEGALWEWQQYSMRCLQLAALQHTIHNKLLPVKLDNDATRPSMKGTSHNRARIKLVTQEMSICYTTLMAVNEMMQRGSAPGSTPSPFASPFSPAELGDNEEFVLDVSDLVPNKTAMIHTNRKDMLAKFKMLLRVKSTARKLEMMMLTCWHILLRKECTNCLQSDNSITYKDDCCMLAVLARLLYSTPLRIKTIEQYEKRNMQHTVLTKEGGSSVPLPSPIPAPSPLGSIGGYELHCRLKDDGPAHIIHLPLEAFEDEEVVVMDMSQVLGWPALLPVHPQLIMTVVALGEHESVNDNPSSVEMLIQRQLQDVQQVSPEILDHMRVGSQKAEQQFQELVCKCCTIACLQQALYNQPITLVCYPGMEESIGHHQQVEMFVEHATEECVKARQATL